MSIGSDDCFWTSDPNARGPRLIQNKWEIRTKSLFTHHVWIKNKQESKFLRQLDNIGLKAFSRNANNIFVRFSLQCPRRSQVSTKCTKWPAIRQALCWLQLLRMCKYSDQGQCLLPTGCWIPSFTSPWQFWKCFLWKQIQRNWEWELRQTIFVEIFMKKNLLPIWKTKWGILLLFHDKKN